MESQPQTLKNSERRTDSVRVRIPGIRRIWGTKKDAPPVTVLQTVRQLTKADSEKKLTVKRKFKEGGPGRRDRWWFLLHGSESILEELSSAWSSVSLQLGWKLEDCTKPNEDRADAQENEEINNVEQEGKTHENEGAQNVDQESAASHAMVRDASTEPEPPTITITINEESTTTGTLF